MYEHLHGGTVEIVLRLPEQEMLWILTWTVNSNEETAISSSELKLWEFRTQNWSTENFKLLGTARPRKSFVNFLIFVPQRANWQTTLRYFVLKYISVSTVQFWMVDFLLSKIWSFVG